MVRASECSGASYESLRSYSFNETVSSCVHTVRRMVFNEHCSSCVRFILFVSCYSFDSVCFIRYITRCGNLQTNSGAGAINSRLTPITAARFAVSASEWLKSLASLRKWRCTQETAENERADCRDRFRRCLFSETQTCRLHGVWRCLVQLPAASCRLQPTVQTF